MISIAARIGDNHHDGLTVADILTHESENGTIPAGSVVLVFTGWSRFYHSGVKAYLGYSEVNAETGEAIDPNEAMKALTFPGVTLEAAEMLVERRVGGVGLDTPSLDIGSTGLGENTFS